MSPRECKIYLDWVGMVIDRKLCKRLEFNHTDKWNMHRLESVSEVRRTKFSVTLR